MANRLQNAFSSFGPFGAAPRTVVQTVQPATPPVPVLVLGTAAGQVMARLSFAPDASRNMGFYGLVLGVLGVWRVAHLLNAEDGPWGIFVRLRRRAGLGFWGELLDCFYCLSLATAVPFALLIGAHWRERLLLWPALSAGAILLERVTGDRSGKTPIYWEDPEVQDGMLRQGEKRPNLHDQTGGCREIEN